MDKNIEKLKPLEAISEPDERQHFFVIEDVVNGNNRSITLDDVYQNANSLKLSDNVPAKVRSHFFTAQNLYLYSWFVYSFGVAAEQLAFGSVEMALKLKFKITKQTSFKGLQCFSVQ